VQHCVIIADYVCEGMAQAGSGTTATPRARAQAAPRAPESSVSRLYRASRCGSIFSAVRLDGAVGLRAYTAVICGALLISCLLCVLAMCDSQCSWLPATGHWLGGGGGGGGDVAQLAAAYPRMSGDEVGAAWPPRLAVPLPIHSPVRVAALAASLALVATAVNAALLG
jgi:hypothetical protein